MPKFSSFKNKVAFQLIIFIILLAAVIIYWIGYGRPSYGIDDANIYFVYMRNFASGHGFVWNIGGEKVEGFTSLLWTLIGSLFYLIAKENYVWLLLALNFLLTFITISRSLSLIRRLNGTQANLIVSTDIIVLALLLFPLGFIEWSVLSLMETGLWIFLIINITINLCNYYLNRQRQNVTSFSIMIAAMILTRPESIVFALAFILIRFLQIFFDGGMVRALKLSVFPLVLYIATLGTLTFWRLSYFGYLLPNTFYAKVSGSEKDNILGGLVYLLKLFYDYPQIAFAVTLLFLSVILIYIKQRNHPKPNPNDKAQFILLAIILVGLLLPVLTGGDHFKFSRFYQCIIPLIYIASLNLTFWKNHIGCLHYSRIASDRKILIAALTIGIFFVAKSTWNDLFSEDKITDNRILGDFQHARNGRESAIADNETFSSCTHYPSVGVLAAGGFGYVYKGNVIDLMGLNSTVMAHASSIKRGYRNHASFDENAFWKLNPDIVGVFYGGGVIRDTSLFVLPENTLAFRRSDFVYTAYKDIFDHPRFISTYKPALIRNKKDTFYLFAYYSTSFLSELDTTNFEIHLLNRRYRKSSR